MKYDELVGELYLVASKVQSERYKSLLTRAADTIEGLLTAKDEFKDAYRAEHDARIEEIKRHHWIPVTERLPEETGAYLVWMLWPEDECPVLSIVHYDADAEAFGEWEEYYDRQTLGWAGSEFKRIEKVYAWMPLPEPPEEAQE